MGHPKEGIAKIITKTDGVTKSSGFGVGKLLTLLCPALLLACAGSPAVTPTPRIETLVVHQAVPFTAPEELQPRDCSPAWNGQSARDLLDYALQQHACWKMSEDDKSAALDLIQQHNAALAAAPATSTP